MKYLLSHIVSFWYRISRPIQPRIDAYGSPDIESWNYRFPWDEEELHVGLKTTYLTRAFKDPFFHFEVMSWTPNDSTDNVCPWFLNLEDGMVQEIDVVEFMNGKAYFGVYWNDKSSEYFDEYGDLKCKKFQIKYRGVDEGLFSVTWNKKRVKWYMNGKPVAVCYHLPIVQPLYLVLSGLHKGYIDLV